MVIDLGTGGGGAVLRRARAEPATLVVGVDADAAAMREASHRAARNARRGGLPNVLFLAAAAEELPGLLAGRAHQVTVCLPWGSLLRGMASADPALVNSVAGLLRAGGELELLLSVEQADHTAGLPTLDAGAVDVLLAAYGRLGLTTIEVRPATESDVGRLSSGWARRLGIPRRRSAWLIRLGTGPRAEGV